MFSSTLQLGKSAAFVGPHSHLGGCHQRVVKAAAAAKTSFSASSPLTKTEKRYLAPASTTMDLRSRQSLLGWFPGFVLSLAAVMIVAFRFFRRKSKLPPGPFGWPVVGSMFALSQPLHLCFAKLCQKYGPVFYLKVGMIPTVVVSSAEMACEVLRKKDAEFSFRPDMALFENMSYGYNDLAFTASDSESFRRLRKICSSYIFSSNKLNLSSQIRHRDVQNCIKKLTDSFDGNAINFTSVLDETATDAGFRMFFGERRDRNETCFLRSLVTSLENEYTQANIGDIFPILKPLDLQKKKHKWTNELMPPMRSYLQKKLDDARRNKVNQGGAFEASCITDFLISLDEADTVPDIQLIGLLTDLIFGGLSTQETTLEWVFSELVRHPHVVARGQEEILRAVGKQRLVEESDLPNLPYIDAIVKESLRLHPPLPIGGPHYNQVASTIGPYTIPAKTVVMVNISAISHDPKLWEDPLEFKPERFTTSKMGVTGGQNCAFIPFSAGRRLCAGYPLVMRYTSLFVASFLQAFDLTPPPGCTIQDIDMSEKPIGLTIREKELFITFTPKN